MKITEQLLLDGYNGVTNGGDLLSKVGKETIYWAYRSDGTTVTGRNDADIITLEYGRTGEIELGDCADHANLARIDSDYQKLWGNEVEA